MRTRAFVPTMVVLVCSVAWLYSGMGLVRQWANDDDYSHGFFVVPLVAFFVWDRRDALRSVPKGPSMVGLVALTLSLLCFVAGRFGAELFLTRASLSGVLAVAGGRV